MQDLDLDELDQAVNKMMDKPHSKRPAKKPAVRHDAPATVPERPVAEPTPAASSPTPDIPARESVPTSRPMPHVPPRRRMHPGAMDIIQPSTPKHAPSAHPGRTGVAVQPTGPVTPEPVRSEPAKPAPASFSREVDEVSDDVLASLSLFEDKPATPPLLAEPEKPTAKQGDWPDPLDFHDFDAPHKEAAVAPEPAKETPPSLEPDALLTTDAPANTTPFVTTKVEKRPLGAYADAQPEATPATAPAPEKEKPALVPDDSTTKEDMAETAMQSGHHLFKPGQEPEHDMDDLRNMAIPQQYHAAHAEPSDKVHSVFDTKEYHAAPQPMHTVRKGNPWLVIAIVVLIVLIVAAAGVGYLMMTGTDLTHLW